MRLVKLTLSRSTFTYTMFFLRLDNAYSFLLTVTGDNFAKIQIYSEYIKTSYFFPFFLSYTQVQQTTTLNSQQSWKDFMNKLFELVLLCCILYECRTNGKEASYISVFDVLIKSFSKIFYHIGSKLNIGKIQHRG